MTDSRARRVALVTGGNRGIGLVVCAGLAKLGMRVLLGSRDAARGAEAVAGLAAPGREIEVLSIDVADRDGWRERTAFAGAGGRHRAVAGDPARGCPRRSTRRSPSQDLRAGRQHAQGFD